MDTLTPKQLQLGNYIIENYKLAAFMTSIKLAEAAGVSNPTVIRFAGTLGYDGYSQMQQHMQFLVMKKMSALERVSFVGYSMQTDDLKVNECLAPFYRERNNLTECINMINSELVYQSASIISKCSSLFICGFQASRCIADYAAFIMSKIKQHVIRIDEWNRQNYHLLDENSKNAVALVVYMPRYPRKTLRIIEELKKRSVRIIIVTDSIFAPGCKDIEFLFALPVQHYSFIDMFSSPITLINSIICCVSSIDKVSTEQNLKRYDHYIKENNIFVK